MSDQKITPFLWFDNNAEEAIDFYTAIFRDSRKGSVQRYGKEGPGPEGSFMTGTFTLHGQEFYALNGGPLFKFNESVSFFIHCSSQDEVDYYWDNLVEGGQPSRCGWLKDKFGLSWQVIPDVLGRLLGDKDREKAGRVMKAMLQMVKIDIAKLEAAYKGE